MIYDPDVLETLPPPPGRPPPPAKPRGWQRVKQTMAVGWFIVLLPFLTLKVLVHCLVHLVRFLVMPGRSAAPHERAALSAAERADCLVAKVRATSSYEARSETLHLRLNDHGIRLLAREIVRTWGTGDRGSAAGETVLAGPGGRIASHQLGYHLHSEFFLPDLEDELTLYTGDGERFGLNGGCHLSGPPALWCRLGQELCAVADAGAPKVVVLDAYQGEWCESDSIGRLIIELDPAFGPEAGPCGDDDAL